MLFGQNREALRQLYRDAWKKRVEQLPMSALETQISDVLADHPEYHKVVMGRLDKDFNVSDGQANPYMHLSLHLAVRDQISTNRPPGIADAFKALCKRSGDAHHSEHQLCELMAAELWRAQRASQPPNEQAYFNKINDLLKS